MRSAARQRLLEKVYGYFSYEPKPKQHPDRTNQRSRSAFLGADITNFNPGMDYVACKNAHKQLCFHWRRGLFAVLKKLLGFEAQPNMATWFGLRGLKERPQARTKG
jgi:hypothetical protein